MFAGVMRVPRVRSCSAAACSAGDWFAIIGVGVATTIVAVMDEEVYSNLYLF